jgi:hypothetical protein
MSGGNRRGTLEYDGISWDWGISLGAPMEHHVLISHIDCFILLTIEI